MKVTFGRCRPKPLDAPPVSWWYKSTLPFPNKVTFLFPVYLQVLLLLLLILIVFVLILGFLHTVAMAAVRAARVFQGSLFICI